MVPLQLTQAPPSIGAYRCIGNVMMRITFGGRGEGVMPKRRGAHARKVAGEAYPYRCCVVCGTIIETVLDVAHLDNDPSNDDADNLAFLCKTHHWMYDVGLYPTHAIKLLRSHWQKTQGEPDHSIRMKDAGRKSGTTRRRSAAAKKAWRTRRSSR